MQYTFMVVSSLLIFLLINSGSAHIYKTGECPSVEAMTDFNMKQFLGVWYAIQKTSTASSCVIYNITETNEPGEFHIEQVSQHFALGLVKHDYSYTGVLRVVDKDMPSKMTVKFPLSVAGTSKFTVYATDYTTYAGIFSCQKLPASHRQSATILSRTKTLDKIFIDKLRNKLASYNVDPFDLSIINQSGCPKEGEEGGFNIHIDPDTFSSQNIGNAVRKAGSAVGTGVEKAVDGIKKLYSSFAQSDDAVPESTEKSRLMYRAAKSEPTLDHEAEWIAF